MGVKSQLFLLLAVGLFAANASELVPVYMWQTIPTKGVFPAVTHVTKDTYKEILLEKQAHQHSDRMIIFAEQNLSPEDFSAKTFYELRQLADHSRVTYMPTVVTPMEVIETFGPEIRTVSVDDIIKNPQLLESKQLIVELDDARDDEDRVEMLKRHSKFIAEVFEKVSASSRDNILAIYTGRHSSWVVPSEIVKHRHTRAASDGKVYKTAHYLAYIDGIFTITPAEGDKKELNITGITETENDKEKYLKIQTTEAEVTLNYVVDQFENWVVDTVAYGSYIYIANFYCPLNFSYSCSSNLTLREHPNVDPKEFKPSYIQFPTFQLQYFPDGVPTEEGMAVFYDSYDCVGFTSIPIWSGLFVTLILAIIISMGLAMIMDIKTMDRFDDPKGKTITVSATD